jgi:twitching motility protein PilJ
MALSLKSFLGGAAAAEQTLDDVDLDEPTTQVKLSGTPKGYDPLGAVSIMEQVRTGASEARQPTRLPLIGHLPIVRQFQILVALLLTFVLLALIMLLLNSRISSQITSSAQTATEMQMLSQRLARGTSLAAQGNVAAFESVKDSRDRFRADLDALTKGGNIKGVNLDVSSSEPVQAALNEVNTRWARVQKNTTAVVDNQAALVTLSKGLEEINQSNTILLAGGAGRGDLARSRLHQPARNPFATDCQERQLAGVV